METTRIIDAKLFYKNFSGNEDKKYKGVTPNVSVLIETEELKEYLAARSVLIKQTSKGDNYFKIIVGRYPPTVAILDGTHVLGRSVDDLVILDKNPIITCNVSFTIGKPGPKDYASCYFTALYAMVDIDPIARMCMEALNATN